MQSGYQIFTKSNVYSFLIILLYVLIKCKEIQFGLVQQQTFRSVLPASIAIEVSGEYLKLKLIPKISHFLQLAKFLRVKVSSLEVETVVN